jgi:hypothetical protein
LKNKDEKQDYKYHGKCSQIRFQQVFVKNFHLELI